ncbi:MAG: crossover junction endodeoxyribonuclease RuvC [Deltaproteobacteria bacterium CG_4_9_14_3_um_filter_51_14]|nr:MAG: crossover junction endodeoxyribonuclease RuvC [Deltaproteobacteria bacterium CG_4_9_14_3_um_filter_51_14]
MMVVLGVDPGSLATGYGLIEKKGEKLICLASGELTFRKDILFCERIHGIYRGMVELMKRFQPAEMAIEDVFFSKNAKSSLKLGHARGAALVAAVECGVRIFEYSPLEIKKAVVGFGGAGKVQVQSMVRCILSQEVSGGLDASDALAVAICHLNWTRYEKPREAMR